MFKMFGLGGLKCPRCDHQSTDDTQAYCAACGMTLIAGAANGKSPVLRDNRWIPAADELAVFFGVRELSGIFSKTLHVPATTRAYILQGDKATEVPQGEYELEGFFSRLNNLFRDQHAEVLITRQSPFPVEFDFGDLHTAEFLALGANFTISVKIDQIAAFAQHFMSMPGTITCRHLQDLLSPSVRQIAAEFIGAQSMKEMAGNPDLRPQLDERLQSMLKMRLAQYGLAVVQVETLSLRHDKFNAAREKLGTLWLVLDEKRVQLEYKKQFDQLYGDIEWQQILREEEEIRLRYRRQELRQQEGSGLAALQLKSAREAGDQRVNRADLAQDEAERLAGIRAREVELYGRIIEAKTRKEALERGAGDSLNALEHELAQKAGQREEDSVHWQHVRALAQIKMRTELEITQLQGREGVLLAQQRMAHQLHQLQTQHQIEQAQNIEDEATRRAQLQRLRQSETDARQRESQLQASEHQSRLLMQNLVSQAKLREGQRLQDWEDDMQLLRKRELLRADALQEGGAGVQAAQLQEKIDALRRSGAQADAIAQHEKLLRTIEAKGMYDRQDMQARSQGMLEELSIEEKRLHLRQQEDEARWQRELAKLAAIGGMSDTGKVAVAEAGNAALLADILKTQAQAGMSAEQILASQAGLSAHAAQAMGALAAAQQGLTAEQALKFADQRVRDERDHRDRELDKDRRHQLDLLNTQLGAHSHALSANMQLGVGVAQGRHGAVPVPVPVVQPVTAPMPVSVPVGVIKHCFRGHQNHVEAKFCGECGAPLV